MESVFTYAEEHPGCRSKKDFSHELYISKEYWEDIANAFDEIESVSISSKIGNIQNEISFIIIHRAVCLYRMKVKLQQYIQKELQVC